MQELVVADGIAVLQPNTDPQSVAPVLAQHQPSRLQFCEPIPERLLDAAAAALAASPAICFRVYGRSVDPSFEWLERFAHVRDLWLDLWYATTFDRLAVFRDLRHLSLGETASTRPSLGFLRALPALEVLRIEGHDRDFATVAEVQTLRELHLRVPRGKTLDPLRRHPRLEVVAIHFGGIRDLTPLASVPGLRALELWQIRGLDTADLDAVGECRSLLAVSLGALRNVTRLTALTRGPRDTLRYLTLERMSGLQTLADLGECSALEQLYLVESKPKDERLDLAARGRSLRHLLVGDHYPRRQIEATESAFRGATLGVRGEALRGDPEGRDVAVAWRRPVEEYLALHKT